MSFQIFSDIKWQRLVLAVSITFLLADSLPHPKLGPSLVSLGLEQLHQMGESSKASEGLSTAAQP